MLGVLRHFRTGSIGALLGALLLSAGLAPIARAETSGDAADRKKHEERLAAALRKLDFGEPLLSVDHTALKRAAAERKLATLTVCADPGNMPFSNIKREGYQNKIAQLLAESMGTTLTYHWRPLLDRGLTRNTFDTKVCDVLMDMPSDDDRVLTTEPLYRTTYVLAWRSDRDLRIESLDDPRLRTLKIGVYQTSALRMALKRRGIDENVSLHLVHHDGDLREEHQPWWQVQQVLDGKLDVAGVWGPFAGWLKAQGKPLTLQPVNLMEDEVPLEFSLSIGLRKADQILRYKIELALEEKKAEVEKILREYGVPLVQCSRCFIAGDLPAHGIYQQPLVAAEVKPDPGKIAPDQRVTRERVEGWLEEGADLNEELANAVLASDRERIMFLVEKGAHVNKLDRHGTAPIHIAARSRKDEIIELLLSLGAEVDLKDRDGFTALAHATLRDHVPSIRLLTSRGGDPEVLIGGANLLSVAIAENHYAAAIALIEGGAKVDSRSGPDELTPLMVVAGREPDTDFYMGAGRRRIERFHPQYPKTLDVARALIKAGADVNAVSRSGYTATMLAAAKNQIPLVGLLVQAGADPKAKTPAGKTALDLARENGNDQVVGLLRLLKNEKRH